MIYVHVGPPKTGSTAIQAALRDNREALSAVGVLAPLTGALPDGRHLPLAMSLCGKPFGADLRPALLDEMAGFDRVVISCEDLDLHFRPQPSPIVEFFRRAGHDVTIVAYLRDHPARLNSFYAEASRSLLTRMTFHDAVGRFILSGLFHHSRWPAIAKANDCRLMLRPYCRAVVADFWSVLSLPPPPERALRPSAGPVAVAAGLAIARRYEMNAFQRARGAGILAALCPPEAPFYGFTADEASCVRRLFAGDIPAPVEPIPERCVGGGAEVRLAREIAEAAAEAVEAAMRDPVLSGPPDRVRVRGLDGATLAEVMFRQGDLV